MNKKIILIITLIVLLTSQVVLAVNLDFAISPSKKIYYPNESIPINISVLNRDVSWAAKNISLTLLIGKRTYNYELGKLSPSQSYNQLITLPEQPPGTYTIRGVLNYTWLFDEVFTTENYNSFEVKFPEIQRLPRNIYVQSFDLPENITSGKTYDVSVSVINNGTIDGNISVELSSLNASASSQIFLNAGQSTIVPISITFYNPGISSVEARVYGVVDNIKYLLNFANKNVYVTEEKIAKIELDKVEIMGRDNFVYQTDDVKLRIYLKNSGNSAAVSIKGILNSGENTIKVTKNLVDYILIAPKESIYSDEFEINTSDTPIGSYNLNLDVNFTDFAGSHLVSFPFTIDIKENVIPSCSKDADCKADETCINGKCEKIICDCGYIENHKCIKYDCCSSFDCPTGAVCDILSHTCIQCIDEHCCSPGKIWCESQSKCLKPTDCVGCPADTMCKNGWPAHEGKTFWINEELNACDIFETCHPDLQYIAKEAAECCESDCKSKNCHTYCSQAYKYSDLASGLTSDRFKKCTGLYVIYGLGPAAKYMQEYYTPEIMCSKSGYKESTDCGRYKSVVYSKNAQNLKCQPPVGKPNGWASDTDMSKNSCLFSDLPAHANIEILSTGTCVDYSTSLTTLLRMVGYTTNEVYSLNGPGHEFNLVRFPGETKWNLVDTVGNYPSPYNPTDVPGKWYPYCKYNIDSCSNDAGEVECPAKNMVKGCS